jgi:hypothetical protein
MKKNYLFKLLLLAPVASLLFLSWSSGYTGGSVTGSPGDGGSTCTQCHGGGNFNASVAITSNIPAGGYVLNTTYNVTVTITQAGSSKRGFQLTAENASNVKVGNFTAGTGSQVFNSGKTVTHTTTGNVQTSWTVTWTSPATDQGAIRFYAAVNCTNGNGSTNGDQVVTTQSAPFSLLGVDDFFSKQFSTYPNPATDEFTIDMPNTLSTADVSIFDYLGRIVSNQTISATNNTINVSLLNSGNYILYIATEEGVAKKQLVVK